MFKLGTQFGSFHVANVAHLIQWSSDKKNTITRAYSTLNANYFTLKSQKLKTNKNE